MVVCGGSTGQGGGCSILGSTMKIQRKEAQTSIDTQEHAAKMAARAQNLHLSVGLMSEIVALYTVSTDNIAQISPKRFSPCPAAAGGTAVRPP